MPNYSWKDNAAKYWYAIVLVVFILAACNSAKFANLGNGHWESIKNFCTATPYFVGIGIVLILWFFCGVFAGEWNPFESIRGMDNRWSTSKCQFFLWTVVAFFSFGSFIAARQGLAWPFSGDSTHLPQNLLLTMGLSVTTVAAAKGITVNQSNNRSATKTDTDNAQLGNLLNNDDNTIDLSKVQMLGWTVIAIGTYLVSLLRTIHHINSGNPMPEMPDVDTSLMVLMGLGQGAYLVKKTIVDNSPTISKIILAGTSPAGIDLTLNGVNFGDQQSDSVITIKDLPTPPATINDMPLMPASAIRVKSWSSASVTFTIATQVTGKTKTIGLTVSGKESNDFPFTF